MTQDTVRRPEPDPHSDHLPRRPAQDGQQSGQHIGALVGALSVLDTRLLDDWGQRLVTVTGQGGRLLVAGDGGSAAQAEYFAAQFTGRFTVGRRDRPAIALPATAPAVSALASDGATSASTAHEEAFARQVRAYGRPGDVLLTVSTVGRNHRLLRAVAAARAGGLVAWCLTGPAPNPLADACDEAVCVYLAGARALSLTATVREAHQVALHLICLSFDAAGPPSGA
jgi:D-sedoheptulose 7-phosphate isomerase